MLGQEFTEAYTIHALLSIMLRLSYFMGNHWAWLAAALGLGLG